MLNGLTRPKLLLVEDDEDVRNLLRVLLKGYDIVEAKTGAEGLSLAFASPPSLILLDRKLPDQDGLELLAKLRSQLTTRHIPVIVLTAKAEVEDRVAGLKLGADDYIAKPFAPAELVARVESALRRSQDALVTDPLTKLPGNEVLRAKIASCLEDRVQFSLCYVDLNNFKAYVDNYGFERASELIQRLAHVCYSSLVDNGAPEDFLGHLGGDDFFFVAGQERAQALVDNVLTAFDGLAPGFYNETDRERGYIEGIDRYDNPRQFPLTTLSVAVIEVEPGEYEDPRALAAYAARCKSVVKKRNQGSSNTGSFRRPTGA